MHPSGATGDRAGSAPRAGSVRPVRAGALHPGVAATLAGGTAARIAALARLCTTGEQRGIAALAAGVDTAAQMLAAAGQLGSVVLRNRERTPAGARDGETREGVAILTGFQVIDAGAGVPMGGENDGPVAAAVLARTLVEGGTPVSLVTDTGAQQVVMESLVGAGLARPEGGSYALRDGIRMHVAEVAAEARAGSTARIKAALAADNAAALVVIERPGPNLQGRLNDMRGRDITAHNADLSGLMTAEGAYRPYTVAIGDGGNELGLGALHDAIGRVIGNGGRIAASPAFAADAVVLAGVSNNGGVALSMAVRAVTGAGGFGDDVGTCDRVIHHLHERGISTDGVERRNGLSVDGRALGTAGDSAGAPWRMPGQPGATHHDMFREMRAIMERPAPPS